ncbi:unnamed protein product [Rotaria socialis]|uniref:Uncharacterized protein n=1 Tax=Rotaria socialis TaxID=392032 RepID=A0A820TZP1_9BILA|nr:unnamed protein product [Rotaria socialis]CAF3455866.1 unnamed protein product [Rotaria socialis]CAF4456837.1 unnamed protein product [Rotaria socialis]CAF4479051.1 unnamed protein product [Rotaria socialis]
MNKFVIVVVLVCLGLVSAGRNGGPPEKHGGGGGGHSGERYGGSSGTLASKACANATVAQSLVTQMQALITQLTSNGSFTAALQQRAQELAYYNNAANTPLLTSNCTQYFAGVTAATALDKAAQMAQIQYTNVANNLIQGIFRSVGVYYKGGRYEK